MNAKQTNSIIATLALSLSFVACSLMFTYSRTLQRSADDIVKINGSTLTDEQKAKNCSDQGGEPKYGDTGYYYTCKFLKK